MAHALSDNLCCSGICIAPAAQAANQETQATSLPFGVAASLLPHLLCQVIWTADYRWLGNVFGFLKPDKHPSP